MLKNFIKPVLIFIPLAVIQLAVIPLISISSISPNLVLVLIVYLTLKNGQSYGTFLGFLLGFFLDAVSGGIIGAYMLSFTISAFIAGYFYNDNKIELNTESFYFLLILSISGCVSAFIYGAVSNSNSDVNFFLMLIEEGLLPGLYTAVFGLPMVIFTSRKGIV
ncbi:MAG: rod shape-determining protein MreD [Ignavibacteriae bacterium HGW-Ignavibacteriae-3]|nr:MAG: rod shape-determining protein MreD [Ignavibacteriae bacterium HGW-Ignavibacteriae-3]